MKPLFIGLLLLIALFSTGQQHHELSIGVGPSFFGWGDVNAFALTATYAFPINQHLTFEPRLISSSGWRKEETSYNTGDDYTYGYNFDITGYFGLAGSFVYTPFTGRGQFFKLKSGFLLGNMAHSYGGIRRGGYPYTDASFGKELNKGLIHTVHFRFLNRENFFIGNELSMLTSFAQGYYNCDGFVWNFMAGIKF
ncbi:MAG TPA: hypothetical protein VKA10_08615 [Prolixibacteraceae bacterium]|nr:hypothetical protein [Prolixibacteraceae bacterium]